MPLKVQSPSQEVNWNRWFGFYNPEKVPAPVPAELRRDLVSAVLRPLKDRRSVEGLLQAVSRLSPTFNEGIRLLSSHDVAIDVNDSTTPSAWVSSGGSMVLQFPGGKTPLASFSEVINTVGLAVPPPSGVERASLFVRATRAEYSEAVWRAVFWNAAIADSFLFQVALELILQGVDLPLPGLMSGILNLSEIRQFSLFRQGGLLGLMHSMSQFLSSGYRESFERQIEANAEQILSGAVPVVPQWQQPETGERPDLARSLLDDCADRIASWGRGLYRRTQKEEARVVRSRRAALVLQRSKGFLPRGREVETLVGMTRQLNRRVAETVLDPVGSSRVSFKVLSGPAQEPVSLVFHNLDFFGISHASPPEIVIDRSQTIQTILLPFLRKMAELGVPEDLYRFGRFVPVGEKERDLSALATYLFYRHCCRQAWVFAVELELLESIGFNSSLGFGEDSPRAKMTKVLETGGLALLIEKMVYLMEPEKKEWAMEQARIHATVLIEAGGLPLFMRHQEGEAVEPGEVDRLVSEMGRVLERLAEERGEGDSSILQVSRTLDLGMIPETVRGLRRLFGGLSRTIQKREGVIGAAIARLEGLIRAMKSGAIGPSEGKGLVDALWPHIDPGTDGEMTPRLSPALVTALQETTTDLPALTARLSREDSSDDLLTPLREETERIRAERGQRIGAAKERRMKLADERRQAAREAREAAQLAERRLRETRLAEEAEDDRREAEALEKLTQEQERRRLEEAERQEGILRARHASVLIHRREELSRLVRDLENAVLEIIVSETLDASDLDREEIELVLGGQRRTIHLKPHWDRRRGEIEGRSEVARKRPLSEKRVTEPMVEEMRQLCDAARSEAAWIASRRRTPH